MLTLDLPDDIYNRLDFLSLSTGRTIQYYATEAIMEYLHEVEDKYNPWNDGSVSNEPTSGCGSQPSMF